MRFVAILFGSFQQPLHRSFRIRSTTFTIHHHLTKIISRSNISIPCRIRKPSVSFGIVLFHAYSVVIAKSGTIHTRRISIIRSQRIIFKSFRFIIFHSDTHFITDTQSFAIPLVFGSFLEIGKSLFRFVQTVIIIQVILTHTQHCHWNFVGRSLLIPFHSRFIVFQTGAATKEIIISHLKLGITIVLFSSFHHIFHSLLRIFFHAIAIFISQAQLCQTTGLFLLRSFAEPFECLIPVFFRSDSFFVATSQSKNRIIIIRFSRLCIPSESLFRFCFAKNTFFHIKTRTEHRIRITLSGSPTNQFKCFFIVLLHSIAILIQERQFYKSKTRIQFGCFFITFS